MPHLGLADGVDLGEAENFAIAGGLSGWRAGDGGMRLFGRALARALKAHLAGDGVTQRDGVGVVGIDHEHALDRIARDDVLLLIECLPGEGEIGGAILWI